MNEQKMEIFYLGLKDNVSEHSAITALAKLLMISKEATADIIRQTNVVLTSGLSESKAHRYFKAFLHAGLVVELRYCSLQKRHLAQTDQYAEDVLDDNPAYLPQENKENIKENLTILFKGDSFEYFKIWIVNIFLTIITLGIYSAWAKVRNKQYFYGNTFIQDSSFRYTAKPMTILKGRLIAFVLFGAYSVINHFNPVLGFILFIVLMVFIPWVIVRSFQFNARNSVFRNIRFNFNGKAKQAANIFLVLPILIPFTFGLIMPYIWFKQTEFFVNHSAFGTSNFKFSATAKDYYKVFLKVFIVLILLTIIVVVFINLFGMTESEQLMAQLFFLSGPVAMMFYLFIIAYSATVLGNLLYNSTTINSHSFSAKLEVSKMAWLYLSNSVGIVLSLGLLIPWAQVRIMQYRCERLTLNMCGSLDNFVNEEQQNVSALGEQVGEVFDMDVSII